MERKFPQKSINPICNNIFLTFSIKRGGDLVSKYDDKEENKNISFMSFFHSFLFDSQFTIVIKMFDTEGFEVSVFEYNIVSASLSILLRGISCFCCFKWSLEGYMKVHFYMSYKYACKYRTNGIKRSNKLTFNLQVHNFSCLCCHF